MLNVWHERSPPKKVDQKRNIHMAALTSAGHQIRRTQTQTKGGITLCRCTFNMVFFLKETISSPKFCNDTANKCFNIINRWRILQRFPH